MADHFYFNGASLIEWNLKEYPVISTRDTIGFRIKTNAANGIILYSRGTQRDYVALQLRDNRMVLNIDLGKYQLSQRVATYGDTCRKQFNLLMRMLFRFRLDDQFICG